MNGAADGDGGSGGRRGGGVWAVRLAGSSGVFFCSSRGVSYDGYGG